jgi:hypothetical protein
MMFEVENYFGEDMTEARMHDLLVEYVKEQYPDVRFISTLVGEFNKSKRVRGRNSRLQSHRGQPDFILFKPTVVKYAIDSSATTCGLALELKKNEAAAFKKDGSLKAGEHLTEQSEWLEYLAQCGFAAMFVCGLEAAVEAVDWYMCQE